MATKLMPDKGEDNKVYLKIDGSEGLMMEKDSDYNHTNELREVANKNNGGWKEFVGGKNSVEVSATVDYNSTDKQVIALLDSLSKGDNVELLWGDFVNVGGAYHTGMFKIQSIGISAATDSLCTASISFSSNGPVTDMVKA